MDIHDCTLYYFGDTSRLTPSQHLTPQAPTITACQLRNLQQLTTSTRRSTDSILLQTSYAMK